jgi:hypothetical protein
MSIQRARVPEPASGLVNFGFSAAELAAIDRNNAVKLMPGLA